MGELCTQAKVGEVVWEIVQRSIEFFIQFEGVESLGKVVNGLIEGISETNCCEGIRQIVDWVIECFSEGNTCNVRREGRREWLVVVRQRQQNKVVWKMVDWLRKFLPHK